MYFKLALGNVRKSIRDYGIYFLTLVFGVCVFYAFNSITAQDTVLQLNEVQNEMIKLLSALIGGVSVFIAVILGFLIVYASRYLIRRRKKEFGTYLLLGMPSRTVSRIIVYETLFVGLISLVIGLFAGFVVSQVLLYISAALFTVQMDMFVFVFSWEALTKTVLYFAVIFLVALVFNTITISRYKLINLINADRKNETLKLRCLPLSVVLFLISLVIIGVSYAILLDNGLREFDMQFALCTVLVCIGTLLLFFSLSGFLLRAIQSNKRLYFRGLNMFTLRQLNSKINTAFLSITLVCMALFLAITSTCGGFALCTAFTQGLESTTRYDASLRASYFFGNATTSGEVKWMEQAQLDNHDMKAALERDVEDWDVVIRSAAQLDLHHSDVSFKDVFDLAEAQPNSILNKNTLDENYLYLVTLSDLNEQRALLGEDSLTLEPGEYLLWCDFEEMQNTYRSFLEKRVDLTIFDQTFTPSNHELETLLTETGSLAMNTGTIVVNDEELVNNLPYYYSVLNVMYNGDREEVEPLFMNALNETYLEKWENNPASIGWPYSSELTAIQVAEQNTGLSVIIAYLAIYIGLVLLLACAAILALQQLSESADNVSRYTLLEKLGVEQKMIDRALFAQIGIYFIFPLMVALCHAICALSVVVEVASLYGHLNIAMPLCATIGIFLVVYGGYFLLTYFASRTMIHQKTRV